jgi:hypothetical protein
MERRYHTASVTATAFGSDDWPTRVIQIEGHPCARSATCVFHPYAGRAFRLDSRWITICTDWKASGERERSLRRTAPWPELSREEGRLDRSFRDTTFGNAQPGKGRVVVPLRIPLFGAKMTGGYIPFALMRHPEMVFGGEILAENVLVQELIAELTLWIVGLAQLNKIGQLLIKSLQLRRLRGEQLSPVRPGIEWR